MSTHGRWLGAALVAAIAAAAGVVTIGGSSAGAAQPGWTVLVYVAADNNLEPFAIPNLMQMASVGSGPGLDIEAFIDRSPKYSDAPLGNLGNWSGAKVVQVNKGSFKEEQNLGNVDSGDPATLSNFISSAAKRHPSDKLALIIWDHGAAWLGTALDEQTNHIIALPKLQQALQAGLAGAGKPKFEMLGFDACLMANTAVLGTLAPLANWITASAELEPGHGWDYSALGAIAGGGGSGADLGKAIANSYQAYATSQNTSDGISLAVINDAAVPALTNAVNGAGNTLAGAAKAVAPAVSGTRAAVLSYGRNPDPKLDFNLVDLGALAASGSAPQLALDRRCAQRRRRLQGRRSRPAGWIGRVDLLPARGEHVPEVVRKPRLCRGMEQVPQRVLRERRRGRWSEPGVLRRHRRHDRGDGRLRVHRCGRVPDDPVQA